MASFNLGRIKGDKGEKGDIGPKGDTGAKGDKGDTGESGRDGLTPVFSIGETHTLSSSEEAYAEINSSDPAAPVLSFYIPRGKDGKDASGDMLSAVYDSEGVGQDFYKYARELADSCLKASGGTLGGALKAAESLLSDGAVRNISVSVSLPESSANGDICIVIEDRNSKKLGDCSVGSIILIEEDGTEIPYIIATIGYHEENSVTLMRRDVFTHAVCFDYSKRGKYSMSDIDVFLETMYKPLLPDAVRRKLLRAKVDYNIFRYCFLLEEADFTDIEYLKTESNRIAYYEGTTTKSEYMLRSINALGNVTCVDTSGGFLTVTQTVEKRFRPAIVLPSDFAVINTEYDESPAVKLPETRCGIYMFMDGQWKECSLL